MVFLLKKVLVYLLLNLEQTFSGYCRSVSIEKSTCVFVAQSGANFFLDTVVVFLLKKVTLFVTLSGANFFWILS